MKKTLLKLVPLIALSAWMSGAMAAAERPNILVIFGDDVGMWNVGAYSHGIMGRTPNMGV